MVRGAWLVATCCATGCVASFPDCPSVTGSFSESCTGCEVKQNWVYNKCTLSHCQCNTSSGLLVQPDVFDLTPLCVSLPCSAEPQCTNIKFVAGALGCADDTPPPSSAVPPSNMPSTYRRKDARVPVAYKQEFWEDDTSCAKGNGCSQASAAPILVASIGSPCGKCIDKTATFCSEDGAKILKVMYSPFSPGCSVPVGDCEECAKVDPEALDANGCALTDSTLCLPREEHHDTQQAEATCSCEDRHIDGRGVHRTNRCSTVGPWFAFEEGPADEQPHWIVSV